MLRSVSTCWNASHDWMFSLRVTARLNRKASYSPEPQLIRPLRVVPAGRVAEVAVLPA